MSVLMAIRLMLFRIPSNKHDGTCYRHHQTDSLNISDASSVTLVARHWQASEDASLRVSMHLELEVADDLYFLKKRLSAHFRLVL